MRQRTHASAIGAIVKEMIGDERYFGDEGEVMSEHSRGDEGLQYRYYEILVLRMMLIFSNEVYWGLFGGSGVPVCTVSSKKKKGKRKEVHTVKRRIIGYTRGDGSVGDGILRVNVGISLVGRIEMFILTNDPEGHGRIGG